MANGISLLQCKALDELKTELAVRLLGIDRVFINLTIASDEYGDHARSYGSFIVTNDEEGFRRGFESIVQSILVGYSDGLIFVCAWPTKEDAEKNLGKPFGKTGSTFYVKAESLRESVRRYLQKKVSLVGATEVSK